MADLDHKEETLHIMLVGKIKRRNAFIEMGLVDCTEMLDDHIRGILDRLDKIETQRLQLQANIDNEETKEWKQGTFLPLDYSVLSCVHQWCATPLESPT